MTDKLVHTKVSTHSRDSAQFSYVFGIYSAMLGRNICVHYCGAEAAPLPATRSAAEIATPGPQFRLAADDVLVVVGQPAQLRAVLPTSGECDGSRSRSTAICGMP